MSLLRIGKESLLTDEGRGQRETGGRTARDKHWTGLGIVRREESSEGGEILIVLLTKVFFFK